VRANQEKAQAVKSMRERKQGIPENGIVSRGQFVNSSDIDSAACSLFAQRGFSRTTMRDIAQALGIQAPSLYNHISSKGEVLDRILLTSIRAQHADLEAALKALDDPFSRLQRGMQAQIAFRTEHVDELLVGSRETLELDDEVRTEYLSYRDRQYDLWAEVVTQGVSTGVFQVPSVRLASIALYDMFNYVELLLLYINERRPVEELTAWYTQLALQMLTSAPTSVADMPLASSARTKKN
jgi:TetR/AcrR family transcriptional regulator, cholesterol catabolism regulator